MVRLPCECGEVLEIPSSFVGEPVSCGCGRTSRFVAAAADADGAPAARLVIRAGPKRVGEQIYLATGAPIEAGKLPEKHLVVEGALVSRSHCRFVPVSPDAWQVEDQRSANGLFINGSRVTRQQLARGDRLRIGEYELEFHADRQETAVAPAPFDPLDALLRFRDDGDPRPAPRQPVSRATTPDPTPARHNPSSRPAPSQAPGRGRSASPAAHAKPQPAHDEPEELTEVDALFELANQAATATPIEAPRPSLPVERAPARGGNAGVAPGATSFHNLLRHDLGGPICPSCDLPLPSGAKICVGCGIYAKSGRPLLTAQGLDENAVVVNTANTIRLLSWAVPFGLYPVASEAYGNHKPYAVRGIAILTIAVSVLFWLMRSNDPSWGRDLLLWVNTDATDVASVAPDGNEPEIPAAPQQHRIRHAAAPCGELSRGQMLQLLRASGGVGEFHWYQLFTHALLHGGIMHLAGNLLFLMVFGSRVNALIGNVKTLILYPIFAVSAALTYMIAESGGLPVPMLGASGAIMGMAGAYFLLFPIHRVYMTIWLRLGLLTGFRMLYKIWKVRGFWVILFFIAFDVVATTLHSNDHVAHWAHLGGFIVGMAAIVVLLLVRLIPDRGADLVSLIFGKYAWPVFGKPGVRITPLWARVAAA